MEEPEKLDDFVQVAPASSWLLLLAFWLALGAAILWLCLGSMTIRAQGEGVVLSEHQAVIYLSALDHHHIEVGMPVYLWAKTKYAWTSPHSSGKVLAVQRSPVTTQQLQNDLDNNRLVEYFSNQGLLTALRVQWDSQQTLPVGTLVDAQVIIRRQSPLSLIMGKI